MGDLHDRLAAPDDRPAGATVVVPGGPAEAGFTTVPLRRIDPMVTPGRRRGSRPAARTRRSSTTLGP